ncbi:hypothetical protein [Spongiactinospora sp. TRM90649]|nr:hypothetical protein [Spongiactinospora sp. TRM90649]MDF5752908.1 hypothetical protein [Spongiactinospora sp. TRM90649]
MHTLAADYAQVIDTARELLGGDADEVFSGTAHRVYLSRVGAGTSQP